MNHDSLGGEVSADEIALKHVSNLISDLVPGSMVQKFILVVETINADGKDIFGFVAPGQKPWDTLGLLSYSETVERDAITNHAVCICKNLDDDDEDK